MKKTLAEIENCHLLSYMLKDEQSWNDIRESIDTMISLVVNKALTLQKSMEISLNNRMICQMQDQIETYKDVLIIGKTLESIVDHKIVFDCCDGEHDWNVYQSRLDGIVNRMVNSHIENMKAISRGSNNNDVTSMKDLFIEACDFATMMKKCSTICGASENGQHLEIYETRYKQVICEISNAIAHIINDINRVKKDFYLYLKQIELFKNDNGDSWLTGCDLKSKWKLQMDKCRKEFECGKNEEDDKIISILKKDIELVSSFEKTFVESMDYLKTRNDCGDTIMRQKLKHFLRDTINTKWKDILKMIENNETHQLASILQMHQSGQSLKTKSKKIDLDIYEKLSQLQENIEKRISSQLEILLQHLNNNNLNFKNLENAMKFANELMKEEYNKMITTDSKAKFIYQITEKLQRLKQEFENAINYQPLPIIDGMTGIWQEAEIARLIEKQENLKNEIKGLPMYDEMKQEWFKFLKNQRNLIDIRMKNIEYAMNQSNNDKKVYYQNVKNRLIIITDCKPSCDKINNFKHDWEMEFYKPSVDCIMAQMKTIIDIIERNVNANNNNYCNINDDKTSLILQKIDQLYSILTVIYEMNIFEDWSWEHDEISKLYDGATSVISSQLTNVETKFKKSIDIARCDAWNSAWYLVYLQRAVHHFTNDKLHKISENSVRTCLEYCQQKPFQFRDLGKWLTDTSNMNKKTYIYCKGIISNYGMFSGEIIKWFNDKIKFNDGDAVIDKMVFGLSDSTQLRLKLKRHYKEFNKTYQELFDITLFYWDVSKNEMENLSDKKIALLDKTHKIALKMKKDALPSLVVPNEASTSTWISLIAHILCGWTFLGSSYYWVHVERGLRSSHAHDNRNDKTAYLRKPNAVQVLTIFALLGIGAGNGKFGKCFAQVYTGEGKSLIAATVGCVLAMIGYNAYVSCYSDELCFRDYSNYCKLFRYFEVNENLYYGTLHQLCNRLIDQDIDVTNKVFEMITNKHDNNNNNNKNKNKITSNASDSNLGKNILIMDEVDVFFDAKSLCKNIQKVLSLKNASISKICDLIWIHRRDIANFIKNSMKPITKMKQKSAAFDEAYKNCVQGYGETWRRIMEREIRDMMDDVNSYDKPQYIVNNDRIGYREYDGIYYDRHARYKTLFAYYYENEENVNRISDDALKKVKEMLIVCASWSFAKLPNVFDNIVGVSGTLNTISQVQLNFLSGDLKYGIDESNFVYMPSAFQLEEEQKCQVLNGYGKLKFDEKRDVRLHEWSDFSIVIEEIEKHCKNENDASDRCKGPVLIFVKNKLDMNKCSVALMEKLKCETQLLYEELTSNEKEYIIGDSCQLNKITIATPSFGRGIDYEVIDNSINEKYGGLHVIQTYFSMEKSQEIQIQGRTARYGAKGSFSMVLNKQDLCKQFNVTLTTLDEIEKSKESIYSWLDKQRLKYHEKQYNRLNKRINESSKQHEITQDIINGLKLQQVNDVAANLTKLKEAIFGQISWMESLFDH